MNALARDLAEPAGSADQGDVDLVRAELARLPQPLLQSLWDADLRVRVCRGSVVEHRPDLDGVRPRGWPEGLTWNAVPGAYMPDQKCVVIATQGRPDGRRYLPPQGERHGSWNLVLHETFHADDYLGERGRCCNPQFLAARMTDLARLGAYERQDGAAGLEESYAESAARHFGADPALPGAWPALSGFWRTATTPVAPGARRRGGGPAAIGTAERDPHGAVRLDLRAESDDGAVGHALVELAKGTAAYDAVAGRLPLTRGAVWRLLEPFP